MPAIARFAWGVLAYDVGVIGWGAYVRATGSGAGCGRHWPMCNGEIVPRSPRLDTLIELSHRASTGAALVLTVALLLWARRAYPAGHRVRRGAAAAVGLMIAEAFIGAGLVLFGLVAHDHSLTRVLTMSFHLVSTFCLLAAMALTAWWASGGGALKLRGQGALLVALGFPLAATLVVGATGAVAALGDTLYPSPSLAAGLAQDLAPAAPAMVHLRALHPLFASLTAATVVVACGLVRSLRPTAAVRHLSRVTGALVVVQVATGVFDVLARAPVTVQLIHLALADGVWVALVLTAAASLESRGDEAVTPEHAPRGERLTAI